MVMRIPIWVLRGVEEEEDNDDEELDHLANDRHCGSDRLCCRSRGKKNLGCPSSDFGVRVHRFFDNEDNVEYLQSSSKVEHHCDSTDDSISDEEALVSTKLSFAREVSKPQENCYNIEMENQNEASTWSEVLEEASELACLRNESRRCGRGRAKPKLSIRTHSHELWSCPLKDMSENSYEGQKEGSSGKNVPCLVISENLKPEMLENLEEEIDEPPLDVVTPEMKGALPSVAEMLENLQEKNGIFNGSSSSVWHNVKTKGKRTTSFGRKIMLNLGNRVLDDEDPLEYMDDEASAEDKAVDQQHLNMASQKMRGQTMTDLFQDTFTASTLEEPMVHAAKLAGGGYYGRLQRVMQIEKDRHLEFLKQSHRGQSSSNDLRGITVQILSRCLEGKLTVCHCLLEEDTEHSPGVKGPIECVFDGGTAKRTVIFSSKICDNVDIEVGNLVRIYPPWKEVPVKEDEKIILCTYFSNLIA